ncbi:MAG: DUF4838 domain-containing protein, partial [bacterium]
MSTWIWSTIATAALTLAMMPAHARAATLVENGEVRATIVLEADPIDSSRQAVTELVDYLQQITGAEVPAVQHGERVRTPVRIFIGMDHDNLARHFPDVDLELTGYNEVLIVSRGDNVLIAGRDGKGDPSDLQMGTHQAVYTFIEKQLGVRWLWPGELGTDVPQRSTVEVPDMTHRFTPPLEQRYLRLLHYAKGHQDYRGEHENVQEIGERLHQASRDWRRRQRVDFKWVGAGHAFTEWWDQYHQEHPEYFALQPNGTRKPYPRADRVKLCITEPGVTEQWLETAVEQFKNADWRQVATASPNDSEYQGYCVCEDCQAWDAKSGPTVTLSWDGHKQRHVALTDRYARWWNILAKRLKEELPNRRAYVATWAYGAYRTPPQEVQLEDNVIVGYIGGLPAYPPERRQQERENWQGWANNAEHLLWRPNFFYFDRGMPIAFAERAKEDFVWLTEHKMIGIDMDVIYGHWALQGMQYYVMAKLTWDPYVDINKVLDDYMTRAFGSDAAPYMRRYFDHIEKAYYRQISAQKDMSGLERISSLPDIRPPKFLAQLDRLLDQARDAVPQGPRTETHRERIAFVRTGLEFTKLHLETIDAMNALRRAEGDKQALRE